MEKNIIVRVSDSTRQNSRVFGGAPTLIPTGDTADLVPLNPPIAGETTVQGLLSQLNTRTQSGAQAAPPTPFSQSTPATEWIWNHNLGYRPTPQVYNLAYQEIDAEIEHISVNQLRVRVSPASPGYIIV